MILPALRRSPRLGEQPAGERRGRHQVGRELRRLERERARDVALLVLDGERARGEQHGALPAPGVARRSCRCLRWLSRIASAPSQSPAAQRNSSTACPAQASAGASLAACSANSRAATGSLRRCASTIQPAQAEQPRVGALRHGAERLLGAGAVAIELRGLRAQQQRQRLARQALLGVRGIALRGARVAGADRDQPARDRLIALAPLAFAQRERKQLAASATAKRTSDHSTTAAIATDADRHDGDHHRGVGAIAEPGDRDLPGPVGEPHDAEREQSPRRPGKRRRGSCARSAHGAAFAERADRAVGELARRRERGDLAPRPSRSSPARARAPPAAGSPSSASAPARSPCAAFTSARADRPWRRRRPAPR